MSSSAYCLSIHIIPLNAFASRLKVSETHVCVPQVLLCEDSELEAVQGSIREALGEGEPFQLEHDTLYGDHDSCQLVGTTLMLLAQSQLRLVEGGFATAAPNQATGHLHAPGAAGLPDVDPVRARLASL